jgi:hypothetical protein
MVLTQQFVPQTDPGRVVAGCPSCITTRCSCDDRTILKTRVRETINPCHNEVNDKKAQTLSRTVNNSHKLVFLQNARLYLSPTADRRAPALRLCDGAIFQVRVNASNQRHMLHGSAHGANTTFCPSN